MLTLAPKSNVPLLTDQCWLTREEHTVNQEHNAVGAEGGAQLDQLGKLRNRIDSTALTPRADAPHIE